MKFLRDIISERSADRPPAAVPPAQQRDRTMTRLPDDVLVESDDIFERLMRDEVTAKATTETEADNLFGELTVPDTPPEPSSDAGPTPAVEEPDTEALLRQLETSQSEPEIGADTTPTSPAPLPSFGRIAGRSARHALPPEPERSDPGAPSSPAEGSGLVSVPAPASGRSARGAGRVKTRLLGFGTDETQIHDPLSAVARAEPRTAASAAPRFPVGWLVVIAGPGRGASFTLQSGLSQIGRWADQAVCLDFGDTAISRSNHAAIAYDAERDSFYLGHGGKANMVRLNDKPVLSTEELHPGALIRIGETTLRFVAFCDESFTWAQNGMSDDAAHG